MKTLKILLFTIFCFCLQSCPGETFDETPDGKIILKNAYSQNIYFTYLFSNVPQNNYLDTNKILSLDVNSIYSIEFMNFDFNNEKKLTIYLYKQSTVDTHTWQEIKDKGLYDKRYDLTLEQLKTLDFMVMYDGN